MSSLSSTAPAWTQTRFRFEPTAALSWGLFSLLGLFLLGALGAVFLQALPALRHEGVSFVGEASWFFRQQSFGALAMIYGTIAVSAIALLLAMPVAVGAAVFTSEYLSGRIRLAAKSMIELLAGVPSVVYGLLGVLLLRDWIYALLTPFDPLSGDTILTAGVLLGVMILPTIMTLCDDALRSVPAPQRMAARGLGLNRAESVLSISVPQAWPGIITAGLLGLGRALGETIAVFLVIGRMDNQLPEKLFSFAAIGNPGQTLTSKLGGPETHIAASDPLHWGAIMGLALLLLALSFFCVLSAWALRRMSGLFNPGGAA